MKNNKWVFISVIVTCALLISGGVCVFLLEHSNAWFLSKGSTIQEFEVIIPDVVRQDEDGEMDDDINLEDIIDEEVQEDIDVEDESPEDVAGEDISPEGTADEDISYEETTDEDISPEDIAGEGLSSEDIADEEMSNDDINVEST